MDLNPFDLLNWMNYLNRIPLFFLLFFLKATQVGQFINIWVEIVRISYV